MNDEEQIAWMIDPEAFSQQTRLWEQGSRGRATSNWESRRIDAYKKARLILAFLKEN